MRILIIVTMTILAIGSSLAGSKIPLTERCPKTSPEAGGLRAVECPAFWPINQGSPLTAAQYSNYRESKDPPYCVEGSKGGKTSILDVAGQTDLGCDYANGLQLSISVPGVPVECRTLFRKRPQPRQLYYRIACYFKPSGDPGKECAVVNIWKTYGVISMDRTDCWMRRSNIWPPSGDILRNCQT